MSSHLASRSSAASAQPCAARLAATSALPVLLASLWATVLHPGPAAAAAAVGPGGEDARATATVDGAGARRCFVTPEGHWSLFGAVTADSLVRGEFGWALRAGCRGSSWGLFVQAEQSLWTALESSARVVPGVLDLGIGIERWYFEGRARSSLAAGPSILLFETILDDRGSTGFFFELRPLGAWWRVGRSVGVGFDPITFAVVAPVLSGVPLVQIQYRTSIYVDLLF